ncbi:TPA: histidine ammonia-lyase, partial [Candidatus Micrarchaeota archaeon]|nr:histidine ammonia-lyase [Candidatus Micrarchaeota archaeon]
LELKDAEAVVFDRAPVSIDPSALEALERAREVLSREAAERPIYGVNTGLGKFSSVVIGPGDLERLQRNLVRSHATGVGKPISEEAVRGILLFRANSLLKGYSGVRPCVVELLVGMLNRGVYPVVPEQGSVGSSGDLVPLAHVALVLLGEGKATFEGEVLPGEEAMRKAGLEPLDGFSPKEGLALLNGTAYMLSLLFIARTLGWRAFRAAVVASALTFQALRGRTEPLDRRIHDVRPHGGQKEVAAYLRELLSRSGLVDSYTGDVQDPYSLRCLPQILGPVLETLWLVDGRLRVEMNSATDNPLVFPDGEVLSGGNFHGEILAFAAEWLCVALSELAASCERRINLLLSSPERGLPPFLAKEGGVDSGLMLIQYTAASLVAENKVLAHPAAVDSVPTSGGKEDHNSFGATSAWKALRIAENATKCVALELVCDRWALGLSDPHRLSPATKRAYEILCDLVPPPGDDVFLGDNIEKIAHTV